MSPRMQFGIVTIFKATSESHAIESPSVYWQAINEILTLTIVLCGVITYIFNPKVYADNNLLLMLGYNNPCIVWDTPPALYIGLFTMLPMIFCAFRMVQLDTKRVLLHKDLTPGHKMVVRGFNVLYMVSMCCFLEIFVISPGVDKSVWAIKIHSVFFVQMIPMLALRVVMDMTVEYATGYEFSTMQKAFLGFYVVVTIVEVSLLGSAVVLFHEMGQDPIVPPALMQCVDYLWFMCLPAIGFVLPAGKPLIVEYTMGDEVPDTLGNPKGTKVATSGE